MPRASRCARFRAPWTLAPAPLRPSNAPLLLPSTPSPLTPTRTLPPSPAAARKQDHFLNAANWQWLSASAFFAQYYRVYSPVTFGRKYDASGAYVRRFVPQVRASDL